MADLIGKSLGRYHILEQLGEGGMATVFKAYDTRLERDVALKFIRREAFPAEMYDQMLKRFEREAKSLAKLSHPNIVKVHDYGEHEGSPYLVLEYLPGGTLKGRLFEKPMPWREAIQLLMPIARALQFAHEQGIIHRDIKPANILITSSGEPMLSDFGIAKILESTGATALTGTGVGMGTPEYMAPEQWIGDTSPASDLYSLGVVLFEMVTGKKPYHADTPAAILLKQATEPLPRPKGIVFDLPDEVERVLIKALAKQPENRYASVAEFIAALAALITQSATAMPVRSESAIPFTAPAPIGAASTAPHAPVPTPSMPFWRRYGWVGLIVIGVALGLYAASRFGGTPSPGATATSRVDAAATSTLPPPSATTRPTLTPTDSPSPTPAINAVALELSMNELRAGNLLNIWHVNSLDVGDMREPVKRSFTGSVEADKEYFWPLKWCTLGPDVLEDNLRHITLTYWIDNVLVSNDKVLGYYVNESGWNCYYWATLVGEWTKGAQVTLHTTRVFDTEINDGRSSYPAGMYITELIVLVK